jgi:APA family basic amino acid/polyamine antiporter
VHPVHGTPYRPTLIIGALTAVAAGLLPIGDLAMLVNIGALSAFVVICASVMILRYRRPEIQRKFRTPWMPFVPLLGIAFSVWLLAQLPGTTWTRFLAWMAVGLVVYFFYGIRKSKLST